MTKFMIKLRASHKNHQQHHEIDLLRFWWGQIRAVALIFWGANVVCWFVYLGWFGVGVIWCVCVCVWGWGRG